MTNMKILLRIALCVYRDQRQIADQRACVCYVYTDLKSVLKNPFQLHFSVCQCCWPSTTLPMPGGFTGSGYGKPGLLECQHWHLNLALIVWGNVFYGGLCRSMMLIIFSSISMNTLKITNQSIMSCQVCYQFPAKLFMNSLRSLGMPDISISIRWYWIFYYACSHSISIFHTVYFNHLVPRNRDNLF